MGAGCLARFRVRKMRGMFPYIGRMKKTLLAAAMSLVAYSAFAQVPDGTAPKPYNMPKFSTPSGNVIPMQEEPYKSANTIYVITTDSVGAAYAKLGRALISKGYSLANANKDFLSITTAPKAGQATIATTLTASVEEKAGVAIIVLRGQFTSAIGEIVIRNGSQMLVPITFGGMNKSAQLLAWQEMLSVATAYQGTKIGYWSR